MTRFGLDKVYIRNFTMADFLYEFVRKSRVNKGDNKFMFSFA